jgi:hypothetical protein
MKVLADARQFGEKRSRGGGLAAFATCSVAQVACESYFLQNFKEKPRKKPPNWMLITGAAGKMLQEFTFVRETFTSSASSIAVQPIITWRWVRRRNSTKTPRWQPRGGDTHLSGR